MKKRLTSVFLVLALAGGVLAGTPLHSGNTNSRVMKCCKKAKGAKQAPATSLARLHCAVYCTESTPTPGGGAANFSPAKVIVADSILRQIALLLATRKKSLPAPVAALERADLPRKIPPKYLQHHSILI